MVSRTLTSTIDTRRPCNILLCTGWAKKAGPQTYDRNSVKSSKKNKVKSNKLYKVECQRSEQFVETGHWKWYYLTEHVYLLLDFHSTLLLMGLLQLRYEHDSSTIRARFGYNTLRDAYDSATIRARYNILRGVMCFRAIMNMSILSRCCRML